MIFLAVFIVAAVGGILVFSGIINVGGSSSSTAVGGTVVLWGTLSSQSLQPFLDDYELRNQSVLITYVQKDPATFQQSLVQAIASGTPPDLVILPDNLIWSFKDELTHIPFASLPVSTYQNTFIDSTNVFQVSDGYLAIPWAADPLIFYYNKDMLSAAGIANPPTTWTNFTSSIPALTQKDSNLTLTQSGAALGTYSNIAHAKDILALLFLQAGNPFMTADQNDQLQVYFGPTAQGTEEATADQALTFYTGFANTQNSQYTWNDGQPLDRSAFLQSTLAYYFGNASELPLIRATNPNLNFGVGLPPQLPNGLPISTGTLYGLAIPKIAPNQLLSYTAATLLTTAASESALVTKAGTTLALMPVRRDVLAQKPASDPYLTLFYNVTLVMKSWLDPDPTATDAAFGTLIENINSNILTVDQALSTAAGQIFTNSGNV